MKYNTRILALIILSLFILSVSFASAQTYPGTPSTPIDAPADLDVGIVTNNTGNVTIVDDAVMFYNPSGTTVSLEASLSDGNGNDFDEYQWVKMSVSGGTETENPISGANAQSYTTPNLEPGYHKFRIYGIINDGTACQSDDFQDIILFVLSPIEVEATHTLNGSAALSFCEDNAPTGSDNIMLSINTTTADYTANTNGYTNPDANDFSFSYQWYYSLNGGSPVAMGTGTSQDITDATTGIASPISPGTYTFQVAIEYDSAIKAKGTRNYVTYTGDVMSGGSAVEVIVTPIPGNPTISIGAVND